MMKIVLDTCTLVWWSLDPGNFSPSATDACNQMEREKNGLVPAIAIWEIAIKIKNNKLDLGVDINQYVASLKQSSVVRLVPIDEELWLESVKLEWVHRDPVDRVVVALARSNQASIITADREIRNFYSDVIW